MFPKQLIALAGIAIIFLASCTSARKVSSNKTTTKPVSNQLPPVVLSNNNSKATAAKKDSAVVKNSNPKIIEKGGKYVFIPPAYMRLKPEIGAEQCATTVLQHKIQVLKKYAVAHHYNTGIAFFIDMRVKSNHNRFFVVDLQTNTIIKQGLVAHGRGKEKFNFDRKYSNGTGSNCTSLGMYKVGKGYNGAFGLSYKLYGLDRTNNNALKRYVVLHAMASIPDAESKYPIMQSEGCPAVSPAFLSKLAPVLDHASKNVLLYIFDSNKS